MILGNSSRSSASTSHLIVGRGFSATTALPFVDSDRTRLNPGSQGAIEDTQEADFKHALNFTQFN